MKSEEQINDLLKQYKFDKEADKEWFPEEDTKDSDLIIEILEWVLRNK